MNATHRQTFDTIPWLVNGRIGDDERRALDTHLRDCAECRSELESQERVYAAIKDAGPRVDYAPGASLQKLWARIGDDASEAPATQAANAGAVVTQLNVHRAPRSRMLQWLVAAVVVEAIGITMLTAMSLNKPTLTASITPAYRVLTETVVVPTTAAFRVGFAPNYSVAELNTLLNQQHLEIVSGPSSNGYYTLATPASTAELPGVLVNLRAHPGVRFAEPINLPIGTKQ